MQLAQSLFFFFRLAISMLVITDLHDGRCLVLLALDSRRIVRIMTVFIWDVEVACEARDGHCHLSR